MTDEEKGIDVAARQEELRKKGLMGMTTNSGIAGALADAENTQRYSATAATAQPSAKTSPYDALERCENCEELKLGVSAGADDVALCPDCVKALSKPLRKRRSDAGKPKPRKEAPEQDVHKLMVELTPQQWGDLGKYGAELLGRAGIAQRYLNSSVQYVALNTMVQKHWKTMLAK